jgi:hypothetical protein
VPLSLVAPARGKAKPGNGLPGRKQAVWLRLLLNRRRRLHVFAGRH